VLAAGGRKWHVATATCAERAGCVMFVLRVDVSVLFVALALGFSFSVLVLRLRLGLLINA
jgi:hypothetical protein